MDAVWVWAEDEYAARLRNRGPKLTPKQRYEKVKRERYEAAIANAPIYAKENVTQQITREGYFRFLDLSPELRNRIYAFATHAGKPQDLNRLWLPPVAKVSRQLWKEALPVYFANNTFTVEVGTNYALHQIQGAIRFAMDTEDVDGWFIDDRDPSYHVSGSIELDGIPRTLLRRLDDEVIRIRDIQILVKGRVGKRAKGRELRRTMIMLSAARKGDNGYSIISRLDHHGWNDQRVIKDLQYIRDFGQATLEYVLEDSPNGLSLDDVQTIARAFRVKPRVRHEPD